MVNAAASAWVATDKDEFCVHAGARGERARSAGIVFKDEHELRARTPLFFFLPEEGSYLTYSLLRGFIVTSRLLYSISRTLQSAAPLKPAAF